MLPGLTVGCGAGIRAPQGASGPGRGVQATVEEMGTHGWAGGGGGHLGALARLGTDAMERSDPRLGWGGQWVSLRSKGLAGGGGVSAGESPEAGPCVSSGEPWDSRPSPATLLERRVGRPELTVRVHQGLVAPEGKESSGITGLAQQPPSPTVPEPGQKCQPGSAKSPDHQTTMVMRSEVVPGR